MKSITKFIVRLAKGSPVFQFLAVFSATLNMLSCGFHYGWPSPTLPQLLAEDTPIPMTDDEGSWIATIFFVGLLCGANVTGLLLDKLGRKKVVLLTAGPFLISWIMIAYAKSVTVLLLARLIAGAADGLMISTLPVYVGEISNPKIRGFLSSCIATIMILGILLMNVIGSYLSITEAALVCAAPPVLFLLTFSWMPESPYYLIMKNNLKAAKRSLQIFKGTENVDQELSRIKDAVEEQTANSGKYLDLFTVKSNRKALFILLGARGAQQLTGVTGIVFYAQTVFKEAGDSISPTVGSIIYFSLQLAISALSSAIIDKTGRRPLLLLSTSGVTVILLVLSCFFYVQNQTDIDISGYNLIPIIALVCFIIIFSIGLQVTPVVLVGELFPANVKSLAMSVVNSYLAILSVVTAKFFQITKDAFGIHVPFFVFAACSALSALFIFFFVPETKGKTLEQINKELIGEARCNEIQIKDSFKEVRDY